MSSWYSICGWVRIRKCPEVDDIVKQLRDHCGEGIKLEVTDVEPANLEISVEGGSLFNRGYVLGIEELLNSLGPSALDAAVLSGDYEASPGK
jgi:hypothetical protein